MFLASEKLASFAVMDYGVGIRYGSGLVKPLHVHLTHKRACSCRTTTNPYMDVLWNATPLSSVTHRSRVLLALHRNNSSFSRV
jgi:hypothetical protein